MRNYLIGLVFVMSCGGTDKVACKEEPKLGEWQLLYTGDGTEECPDSFGTIDFFSKTYFQENCDTSCTCTSDFFDDNASCKSRTFKEACSGGDYGTLDLSCTVTEFSQSKATGTCHYVINGTTCNYTLSMLRSGR